MGPGEGGGWQVPWWGVPAAPGQAGIGNCSCRGQEVVATPGLPGVPGGRSDEGQDHSGGTCQGQEGPLVAGDQETSQAVPWERVPVGVPLERVPGVVPQLVMWPGVGAWGKEAAAVAPWGRQHFRH